MRRARSRRRGRLSPESGESPAADSPGADEPAYVFLVGPAGSRHSAAGGNAGRHFVPGRRFAEHDPVAVPHCVSRGIWPCRFAVLAHSCRVCVAIRAGRSLPDFDFARARTVGAKCRSSFPGPKKKIFPWQQHLRCRSIRKSILFLCRSLIHCVPKPDLSITSACGSISLRFGNRLICASMYRHRRPITSSSRVPSKSF